MIRAFSYLLACGIKNRVLLRLKRLRHLKYLISALAGMAYLYFVFTHWPDTRKVSLAQNPFAADSRLTRIAETGFALLLLGAVVFQWFFARGRKALFNEAEIQLLFPAPVSRRALLHYHMAKAQIGIALGTILSVLVFGRGLWILQAGFFFAGLWAVYFFLYLCRVAIFVLKRILAERGVSERQLRAGMLGLILLAVCTVTVWTQWYFTGSPLPENPAPWDVAEWFQGITSSGPAFYLLFPFRMMVRPALTSELCSFATSLVPALIILVCVYGWIQHTKTDLGETIGYKTAPDGRLRASQGGEKIPRNVSRRPPFLLAANGAPFVALYWKNLILAGGLDLRVVLPPLAAIALICILFMSAFPGGALVILGAVAAALAGFLTLLGPVMFREDLRTDLKNIDMLKSYPVPGWGIVLGEALGPATVLAILEWALILIAVATLPGFESVPWKLQDRISAVIGAAVLLPSISFFGVLIQNATVLTLPGWVHLGREHQQGVEAMGQRLISSIATVLFLLIAALPAAALFSAAMFAGYPVFGWAVVPAASLAAATALLAESAAAVIWLGRIYDRLDTSDV
jgi:hypothetical protein